MTDLAKNTNNETEQAIEVISPKGQNSLLKTDTIQLLSKPGIVLGELVTGAIASRSDLPVIGARVIQGALKGKLLSQLGKELDEMRKKGTIKEDYFASNDADATLNQLLEFIDTEIPDREKFKALVSIYLAEISTETLDGDRQIAHELFKASIKLESMDVLILKTCYDIYNLREHPGITAHGEWVRIISDKLGIRFQELISMQDDKLVSMGLLSPRSHGDKSGVRAGPEFRLTGLGMAFCDFVTRSSK